MRAFLRTRRVIVPAERLCHEIKKICDRTKFCDTHILKDNLNKDLILESVVGYLIEKQDEHSLTKIEEIELKRLTLLLKLDHEYI